MPISGLGDVQVLATRPPGTWQERQKAKPLGKGVYAASVPIDQPGVYYVSVGMPAHGVDFTQLPFVSFFAVEGRANEEGEEGR